MAVQLLIVVLIVAAALAYAGVHIAKKRRSFSAKNCEDDCGCGKS